MEKVAFVSTMEGYAWGGSEELWSRAALALRAQGLAVSASVREWKPLHARMRLLSKKGVDLWLRPENYPIVKLGWPTACGTPVVVSDVGGVRDYVGPDCGALCRPGDDQAHGAATIDLLRNSIRREAAGRAARARARVCAWPVVQ